MNRASVPQGEGIALAAPAVHEPVIQRKPDVGQIGQVTSLQKHDRQGFQQSITQQSTTQHDAGALRSRALQELMDETSIDVDIDDAFAADIMTNMVASSGVS